MHFLILSIFREWNFALVKVWIMSTGLTWALAFTMYLSGHNPPVPYSNKNEQLSSALAISILGSVPHSILVKTSSFFCFLKKSITLWRWYNEYFTKNHLTTSKVSKVADPANPTLPPSNMHDDLKYNHPHIHYNLRKIYLLAPSMSSHLVCMLLIHVNRLTHRGGGRCRCSNRA